MFYGAKPKIFERARELRENMTEAEKILWDELKENKMGVRFKPQHPASIFILDFYCHALKICIELDGEIHQYQKQYDESRTDELKKFGIMIIRFSNEQLYNEIETVLKKIEEVIIERRKYISENPDT